MQEVISCSKLWIKINVCYVNNKDTIAMPSEVFLASMLLTLNWFRTSFRTVICCFYFDQLFSFCKSHQTRTCSKSTMKISEKFGKIWENCRLLFLEVSGYLQDIVIRWNSGLELGNPSRLDLGRREKLTWIFIFTLYCGTTKDFMKALKAFIKPFEAPQRSVKIKI